QEAGSLPKRPSPAPEEPHWAKSRFKHKIRTDKKIETHRITAYLLRLATSPGVAKEKQRNFRLMNF
ncbi:MAG TPA: hypothetical protein VJR29_12205, partial [bacterium]|nr:hypothetical protein [bacterium]